MATPRSRRRFLLAALGVVIGMAVGATVSLNWSSYDALTPIREALAVHDLPTAARLLNEAAETHPGSAERALLKARYHRRMGQLRAFRQSLTLAANLGSPPEALEREQILMLAQQGQLSVSSAEVSELLAAPGDDTLEIYQAVVRGCLTTMQLGEAELFLDGWQSDYPDDPMPDYYLGLIDEHRRNWPAAATAFASAVEKGLIDQQQARRHLADALRSDHHYREAVTEYERCDQDDVGVLRGLAGCYESLRDLDAATRVYAQLLARFPEDPAALSAAGRLAARRGDHQTAAVQLARAVELNPSDMQAWHALGWARVALGTPDEAQTAFRKAVRLSEQIQRTEHLRRRVEEQPANPTFRLQLADIFLAEGRIDDGLMWLRSVLQVDPDNAEARQALEAYSSTTEAAPAPPVTAF
jgi:tetratricopeptide (TPR) repeat protein